MGSKTRATARTRATATARARTRSKISLKRKTRTRKRRGGNGETSGDKLMNMVYENAMTVETKKPHTDHAIIRQFNRVKEDDLYNSVLRFQKKYPQTPELKDKMWRELYPYQDEYVGEINRIPECKYNKKGHCTRRNPVHRFADERRLYHPASLVSSYLKGV